MSLFDQAFDGVADTFSDVFGDAGTWTAAADGATPAAAVLIITSESIFLKDEGDSRFEVHQIEGRVRKSDVSRPMPGDTWTRTAGGLKFKLRHTPSDSEDGNHWLVVVERRIRKQAGGTATVPVYGA